MENQLLQVGKIINTCGLKGEVKIYSTTFYAKERYKKNNKVLLGIFEDNDEKYISFTVKSYRNFKGFDYVIFNEISSIEEAEKLVGKFIFIKKEDAKIKKDEYLFVDLVNCKIIDQLTNEVLGTVIDIYEFPASISLKIKTLDEKIYNIPFIKQFITKVDINNKVIFINNMEGLLKWKLLF